MSIYIVLNVLERLALCGVSLNVESVIGILLISIDIGVDAVMRLKWNLGLVILRMDGWNNIVVL